MRETVEYGLLGKTGTSNYIKAEQLEFSTSCALHNQNFEEKSETELAMFLVLYP